MSRKMLWQVTYFEKEIRVKLNSFGCFVPIFNCFNLNRVWHICFSFYVLEPLVLCLCWSLKSLILQFQNLKVGTEWIWRYCSTFETNLESFILCSLYYIHYVAASLTPYFWCIAYVRVKKYEIDCFQEAAWKLVP